LSEFRIPPASSSRFHSLPSKKAKDEFISSYREWRAHPFTKDLVSYLEDVLESEVLLEEKKTDFWSKFHFKFSEAVSKGKRYAYRKLIKEI
jgi:hypothetical protein